MVDVVTAGFPCQPFSVAGKQQGADDERNMWPETLAVLRAVRPRFALLENVPGLFAHEYARRIFADLAESGFDARWRVLSAAELGAPHKRDRVFILASYTECEGLQERFVQPGVQRKKGRDDDGKDVAVGAWWTPEPELDRLANGTPNRVERIRSAGNSQVPAVVRAAWQLLNGDL